MTQINSSWWNIHRRIRPPATAVNFRCRILIKSGGAPGINSSLSCGRSLLRELNKTGHPSDSEVGLLEQISVLWSVIILASGLHNPEKKNRLSKILFPTSTCTFSILQILNFLHQKKGKSIQTWALRNIPNSNWRCCAVRHAQFPIIFRLTFIASIQAPIVTSSLLNIR